MIEDSMAVGGHIWEKQNLVTKFSSKGYYDIYKCRFCGLEGKSYHFGFIEVRDNQSKKLHECPRKTKATKIKITRCFGFGPQFDNLKPGSVHNIVNSPQPEASKKGEWVMGVSEKVLVLYDEFTYVYEE